MISTFTLDFFLTAGPLFLFILSASIRHRRNLARMEREGPEATKPLGPDPIPRSNVFAPLLDRFPAPQRRYLHEQIVVALLGTLFLAWLLLVSLTGVLLPSSIAGHTTLGTAAFNVWYTFANNLSLIGILSVAPGLLTALLTFAPFVTGSQSNFYLTRPFTKSFLFWARILPALAALILAALLGILLSLAVILLLYGPVWQNLAVAGQSHGLLLHSITVTPHAPVERTVLQPEARQYLTLIATSVPRLLLSIVIRTVLFFSLSILIALQPFALLQKPLGKVGFVVLGAVCGNIGGLLSDFMRYAPLRNGLFFYSRLGPPPPWSCALIPLALSAAMLLLARYSFSRREA